MLIIKKIATISLALFFFSETGAQASSFEVSPIRVFFNKELFKDKITIINNGVEDVSLQITVKKWVQDISGKDSYLPTKDIIFFPKLFSITRGEKRVVRLGYKGKNFPDHELTYRLFADEIRSRAAGKSGKLNLLLKIGVPIFITPGRISERLVLTEPVIGKERISVTVKNLGNTHHIIKKVSIEGIGSGTSLFKREKRGWYILSGKTTSYSFKLSKEECSSLTKVSINVATKKRTLSKEVGVDSSKCSR